MKITPTQLTIGQLLGKENEQFFIPAYQRRYAWTDKQLIELYEDIEILDEKEQHFLGTILTLTEVYRADINLLEVVDGQQRLISLSLLLEAIKDRFEEFNDLENVRKIEGLLCCQGLDRIKQNKVILGDLDEPDYAKVLKLKKASTEEDERDIKNQRLLNAYKQYSARISKYSSCDLYRYYFKLANGVIVVRLDTEKARDAYKLFETINNRGLRLSSTDIIKNFLLGHASLVGEKELKEVRESWTKLIVCLDGIDSDDFFRHQLMSTLAQKITFAKLAAEFKRYYLTNVKEAILLPEYRNFKEIPDYLNGEGPTNNSDEDEEPNKAAKERRQIESDKKVGICDFGAQLGKSALIYSKILNVSFDSTRINDHIRDLKKIESTPAYTFLIKVFARLNDEDEIVAILKVIESFILRRHICERRTAELDDIFTKLVAEAGKCELDQVKEVLRNHLPDDVEFEDRFATYSHKRGENRAKYILRQIEYFLIQDQGEYQIKPGQDVHLEHVIPVVINTKKSIRENGDWITYLGKDALVKHERYVDRIGNYTLLAQRLNIKASNNPFKVKRREYKKSNLRITQILAQEYGAFRYRQVEQRSKAFAKIAVKIWSF